VAHYLPFTIRDYRPTDEPCVVSWWLRSYSKSPIGKRRGADKARSKERDEFWDEQGVTARALIEAFGGKVLVDAADDAVVWAFACTSDGPMLHFLVANEDFSRRARTAFIKALVDVTPALKVTQYCRDLAVLGDEAPRHVHNHLLLPAILKHLKG